MPAFPYWLPIIAAHRHDISDLARNVGGAVVEGTQGFWDWATGAANVRNAWALQQALQTGTQQTAADLREQTNNFIRAMANGIDVALDRMTQMQKNTNLAYENHLRTLNSFVAVQQQREVFLIQAFRKTIILLLFASGILMIFVVHFVTSFYNWAEQQKRKEADVYLERIDKLMENLQQVQSQVRDPKLLKSQGDTWMFLAIGTLCYLFIYMAVFRRR